MRVEHNLRRVETTIGANQQTIDAFNARRTELVENNKEFTDRIEALNRSTQQVEVTTKSTDELRAAALKKVDESPQGKGQHKAILQGMQFRTVLSINVVLDSEAQKALDALAEAGEESIELTERSVTIDDVVIPARRDEEGRYVFSIEGAQELIEALSN